MLFFLEERPYNPVNFLMARPGHKKADFMVAFIETLHFNKADFISAPLEELDKISGRMRPMNEVKMGAEDARLKITADGPHALHVSLPRSQDGTFRVSLSLYSAAYEIVTRVEFPLSEIVAAYDAKVKGGDTSTPDVSAMELARIDVEAMLRKTLSGWIKGQADSFFQPLSRGLVRAVFDLRAARDTVKKIDLKKVAAGGAHRTYDDHRRST